MGRGSSKGNKKERSADSFDVLKRDKDGAYRTTVRGAVFNYAGVSFGVHRISDDEYMITHLATGLGVGTAVSDSLKGAQKGFEEHSAQNVLDALNKRGNSIAEAEKTFKNAKRRKGEWERGKARR